MLGDPLDDLVLALIAGTRHGTVKWQQADARGNAYIAKRPSGTVTVQRGAGGVAAMLGGTRLVVKNERGETVREYPSSGFAGKVGSPLITGAGSLDELYNLAQAQVSGEDQTVRRLADEFRSAAG
jgi:hypothetical protein